MAKKKKTTVEKGRGDTWVGYFPRVTKDKTKYNRKKKHRNKEED